MQDFPNTVNLIVEEKVLKEIKRYGLKKKFDKQKSFLLTNPSHRSLDFKPLEPKDLNTWSFRVDLHFRALLIREDENTFRLFKVGNHL